MYYIKNYNMCRDFDLKEEKDEWLGSEFKRKNAKESFYIKI